MGTFPFQSPFSLRLFFPRFSCSLLCLSLLLLSSFTFLFLLIVFLYSSWFHFLIFTFLSLLFQFLSSFLCFYLLYSRPPRYTFSVFKMLLSFVLPCLYFFPLFPLCFQVFPKMTFYPPFLPLRLFPSYSIPPSFFSTSSLHLCSAEGCRGASMVNYPASITSTYSATPFHTPSSASRGAHTLTHTLNERDMESTKGRVNSVSLWY